MSILILRLQDVQFLIFRCWRDTHGGNQGCLCSHSHRWVFLRLSVLIPPSELHSLWFFQREPIRFYAMYFTASIFKHFMKRVKDGLACPTTCCMIPPFKEVVGLVIPSLILLLWFHSFYEQIQESKSWQMPCEGFLPHQYAQYTMLVVLPSEAAST